MSITNKYRTRYMLIFYIVPDRRLCYNYDIMEEVCLSMPASKAQQKAVAKYMKDNYDEIKVRVPKGRKAELQAHAEQRGESLNGFIGRAIDEQVKRDNGE